MLFRSPTLLQEATLRGATAKIDLLFLEEYYHARQACPVLPEVTPFEGGSGGDQWRRDDYRRQR